MLYCTVRKLKGGGLYGDLADPGARVTDPSQKRENEPLDVLIRDGVVAELGPSLSADAREIRADGLDLLPGLVDIHVHLRDPGQTHKEDILSAAGPPPPEA